jgi:predicted phage terminase large subunit-like protein
MTSVEAQIDYARQRPEAFLALCMGKTPSGLQKEMISHALNDTRWYAELPRGHAKTSTFAHLAAWWIGVRPNTRIKVIAQTDEHASATTKFIREIVKSSAFKACFPHVRLKSSETGVTAWSVTTPGMKMRRDPTVQGMGIFGRTGGRADVMWLDDICDLRNSVLQPALRSQVKEAYANIWLPMLDPSATHEPRLWRTATPFHTDDLTAEWRRECIHNGTLLRRPCMGLESPWGEVFTEDVLRRARDEMGALAYARAYELVPLSSDLLIFRPEWFGYYPPDQLPSNTRTIAGIDWGYGKAQQSRNDPDYSVCIIGEIDHNRNLYITEMLRVRESFPVFAKQAAELLNRRGVSVVLAEANGTQKGIFDQFALMTNQPMMAMERTKDKHIRAAGSQPFVQSGKLKFPTDQDGKVIPVFQSVIDELLSFPAGAHDDCVDVIVDMCSEAVRGSLGAADKQRLKEPQDAINRIFSAREPKGGKAFFS